MFIRVVDDSAEDHHKEADESGNVHAEVLVEGDLAVADGHRHVAHSVLVVEFVVVVYLFADFVCRHEQADNLVTLGRTVYFSHDSRPG
jgi:hypothetical protein